MFRAPNLHLMFASTIEVKRNKLGVVAEFSLNEGETAVFVIKEAQPDEDKIGDLTDTIT